MKTAINTPTDERKLALYLNFKNSKRIQWSGHRRFTF